MIKKAELIIFSVLMMISCNGVLWNGDSQDTLKLSINNPFYQHSSSSRSRALALQGKYLYIELALIEDQELYLADTDKLLTGNGTWVETNWGGHGIVNLTIGTENTVDAIFKGVPKDQPLQARVFLDFDKAAFETSFEWYGSDGYPICWTYNPAGQDFDEQSWISISVEDLNSNVISLPLIPYSINSLTWSSSLYLTDDYVSTPMYLNSPSVGETQFYYINPDISALQVRDLAYFSLVYGSVPIDNSPPISISLLYDINGIPFDTGTATYAYNATNLNYDYKLLQIQNAALSDYTSPDYFLGTTLLISPLSQWNLSFGVLYDEYATHFSNSISWTVPAGFIDGDLEFNVIQTTSKILTSNEVDTIVEINALDKDFNLNWDNSQIIENTLSGSFDSWDGSWFIILARIPGGEPFIFGRIQALG